MPYRYRVYRPEVHIQPVDIEIENESPSEAVRRVKSGEGEAVEKSFFDSFAEYYPEWEVSEIKEMEVELGKFRGVDTDQSFNPLEEILIEHLNIHRTRTVSMLADVGIDTVEDLRKYVVQHIKANPNDTWKEALNIIRGFGDGSISDLIKGLNGYADDLSPRDLFRV